MSSPESKVVAGMIRSSPGRMSFPSKRDFPRCRETLQHFLEWSDRPDAPSAHLGASRASARSETDCVRECRRLVESSRGESQKNRWTRWRFGRMMAIHAVPRGQETGADGANRYFHALSRPEEILATMPGGQEDI